MMDGYRNLPPERILSMPGKEAAAERFMAVSADRLSSQIFHVNFCDKLYSIFRYFIYTCMYTQHRICRILSPRSSVHYQCLSNKFLLLRTMVTDLT